MKLSMEEFELLTDTAARGVDAESLRTVAAQTDGRAMSGPVIEETDWGYIIRETDADTRLRIAGSITGRFVGAILLMAAGGLWVMPDALHGAELFGIKLAAMVMFAVLGGYLFWAGRHALQPEFRIDRLHNEIRIGFRGRNGEFRQRTRLDFGDIVSVFLLRSKDNRPTRLFLRLADLGTGIEITSGSQARMEILKLRLMDDLTAQRGPQTAPVRPVRPRRVAA